MSQFFSTNSAQQLRDLDILHDNRDTKFQNLSKYLDEDEELYEVNKNFLHWKTSKRLNFY